MISHRFDPLTHPSTHPPTKNITHPWVGNSPQIPNLQTESKYLDSFKSYSVFTDFGEVPPVGGGWLGGVGWVGLGGGTPHERAHGHAPPHMCTCTCAHTCMHVKHDKHGCLYGGGHLQFSNMFIFTFRACACMHVCVHVSRDTPPCPQMPPNPSDPSPEPQGAAGSTNHQKFISPELIEII